MWQTITHREQPATQTYFVYDGDTIVAELDANGNPVVEYNWGLLGPIARLDLTNPSNNRYYISDALGHTRLLLDSTGGVKDSYVYDAWGNLLQGSDLNTPNPFTWNGAYGYEWLEFTGLYHVGAREYDPRTARWLQRDPIGVGGGHPNVYLYCGNDSVNVKDPSGLEPKLWTQITMALAKGDIDYAIFLIEHAASNMVSRSILAGAIARLLKDKQVQAKIKDVVSGLPNIHQVGERKLPDCQAYAQRTYDILKQLGAGEETTLSIIRITPKPGQAFTMPLVEAGTNQPGFREHWVVRWGDTIVDTLAGPGGQNVNEWVKRWIYIDNLKKFNKFYQCDWFSP